MPDICFVYVTVSGKEEALKIADAVVSERLAACANVIDNMTSVYWWEDQLERDNEAVLILKTTETLFSKLEKRVKELHSYSCPCISALPIANVSKEYAAWIVGETKQQG